MTTLTVWKFATPRAPQAAQTLEDMQAGPAHDPRLRDGLLGGGQEEAETRAARRPPPPVPWAVPSGACCSA